RRSSRSRSRPAARTRSACTRPTRATRSRATSATAIPRSTTRCRPTACGACSCTRPPSRSTGPTAASRSPSAPRCPPSSRTCCRRSIGRERIEAEGPKGRRNPDQRQADQSRRVAAPDRGKEDDAEPFGPEAAGAVVRLLEPEVAVERVAVEAGEIDLSHVHGPVCRAVAAVDDGGGGVEHDGAAAAGEQLLERSAVISGLAQDPAAERRDLIGADHERRRPARGGLGLRGGEPRRGGLGGLAGRDLLVDVRRAGLERQPQAGEQLCPVLGGRSQNELPAHGAARGAAQPLTCGFDSINTHLYHNAIMPASLFSWYGARELSAFGERRSVLRGEIELKRFNRLADM